MHGAHLFKLAIQNECYLCIGQLRTQGSCISHGLVNIQYTGHLSPMMYGFIMQQIFTMDIYSYTSISVGHFRQAATIDSPMEAGPTFSACTRPPHHPS